MTLEIIAGGITAPKGFLASGVHVGVKQTNLTKKDVALIFSQYPATAAGVFTTNKVQAAPVLVSKENVKGEHIQAVVVNSGNANACTGEQGMVDARAMAEATAGALELSAEQVIVASTGVIGVQLPIELILGGIKQAADNLGADGNAAAAEAIMTTDTYPKEFAVQVNLGGKIATIGAMAKGSGMIHPNMATMLAFVTTDAAVEKSALEHALKSAVEKSFNMISVDGDTSTNDMLVVLANGQAGNAVINTESPEYPEFCKALEFVCVEMAKSVARDGEGATKLVEIQVQGAKSAEDAKKAAMAVAKSSLVKTAIFGSDANWGRILCAVGYSGADLDPACVDLTLEDAAGEISEQMMSQGTPLSFDEERAKNILDKKQIIIKIELNQGTAQATAWGCDLTYDYVRINADYRT